MIPLSLNYRLVQLICILLDRHIASRFTHAFWRVHMDFFGSSPGNDVKRFIKRKDSDAGEAGRALEELRSSLYNEFRTSEGAKRQQERYCGPSAAMTFNFTVAVSIILGNKLVCFSFSFPLVVLFCLQL